jgi:predicted nucleic acid-binding Zn ribbon protein
MIHATTVFDDDPDVVDWNADARKLGRVCPVCGESIADDSELCRKCAPVRSRKTPGYRAKVARQRFMRLVRKLDNASEGQRRRILETVVWP